LRTDFFMRRRIARHARGAVWLGITLILHTRSQVDCSPARGLDRSRTALEVRSDHQHANSVPDCTIAGCEYDFRENKRRLPSVAFHNDRQTGLPDGAPSKWKKARRLAMGGSATEPVAVLSCQHAGCAVEGAREREARGMLRHPLAEAGKPSAENVEPFTVHPGRHHQQREQPGEIIVAAGAGIDESD